MARKCFIISLEISLMVYAESERDAERVAGKSRAFDEEILNYDSPYWQTSVAQHIPSPWSKNALVYHDGPGDITVAEALANTPEYQEFLAKLKAVQP